MVIICMYLGFRMNLNVMKKVILVVCGFFLIVIGLVYVVNKDENIEVILL